MTTNNSQDEVEGGGLKEEENAMRIYCLFSINSKEFFSLRLSIQKIFFFEV
jgi:hypothetical protein